MPRVSRLSWLLAVLLTSLSLPAISRPAGPERRPSEWAIKLERPGLPNLYKVNDGLYRGAQPTSEGVKELERLGIKTIVCLRSSHSDKEILGNSRISYEAIPMQVWGIKEGDVVRFLKIVTDENRQPVFIHCQYGADRTGVMCAVYRIAVDGWSKPQAIGEMTKGGFGFHSFWTGLIAFITDLDVANIKIKAGLAK